MAGKHDVYVFYDSQNKTFKVRPAVASVEHDHGVKVRNLTDYPIMVRFADDVLTQYKLPPAVSQVLPTLPPALQQWLESMPRRIEKNSGDKFHFKSNVSGLLEYNVDVETPHGTEHAVGESSPKIIVDP